MIAFEVVGSVMGWALGSLEHGRGVFLVGCASGVDGIGQRCGLRDDRDRDGLGVLLFRTEARSQPRRVRSATDEKNVWDASIGAQRSLLFPHQK